MTVELDLARENAAYKWFVEGLAEIANHSVDARRIRELDSPDRSWVSDDTLLLTVHEEFDPRQREIVATMLEEAVKGAVHDVAALLEWRLSAGGLKMSVNGADIPASPYASMHYDLISILEGDTWPDE